MEREESKAQHEEYMSTKMVPKSLVIIEPTNFQINFETLKDNCYMQNLELSNEELSRKVLEEHKNYQRELERNKVSFRVYKQVHEAAYDSIFACDWCCVIKNEDFPEGIVFVFPMRWPSRRLEKNNSLIESLRKEYRYFEDLSLYEEKDLSLESVGTMSIDFHNRVVYANLSERCHMEPLNHFVQLLNKHSVNPGYKIRLINALDPQNSAPVFHTGLYLAFVDKTVFFSREFITSEKEADDLVYEFTAKYAYKYNLVLLSEEETRNYCANVLEAAQSTEGKTFLIMSKTSLSKFSQTNLKILQELYDFIVVDVDTINMCAGGSLRCMANMLF